MRFKLIDRAKKDFPVQRLCRVLGVSQSGYFAWKSRLPSQQQREDMVMLAYVRSAVRVVERHLPTSHMSGPGRVGSTLLW